MEELFQNSKQKFRIKEKESRRKKRKRPGAQLGRTREASRPNLPRADPTHSFLSLSLSDSPDPPVITPENHSPLFTPSNARRRLLPGITGALTGHQARPYKAPALLSRPSLFSLKKKPPGCWISPPEPAGAAASHRRFRRGPASPFPLEHPNLLPSLGRVE
jgi:hypothetical protein